MEKNISAILEGLNQAQSEAVRCVKGPVLIVAGAGSGKTRVLTSRIAYLIFNGVEPSRILSLTFTKKAAQEMKERANKMLYPKNARKVCMGTFHSVFIRFLRDYADRLGFPKDFTIYDTSDSQSMMKTILKERGIDPQVYKPKDVLSRISMAKNNLCLPNQYLANRELTEADAKRKMPLIGELYLEYMKKCRNSGVMDFDDILVYMNILCRDFPDALDEIAHRFDYVMVDEYQDTNYSQYLILKKLSQFHRNLCVVGDDSQSIYAFRGAKVANILNFSKDYPDYHIFRLEQNYRSTQVIVDAANSLIEKNRNRIKKVCFSKSEEGDRIRIIQAYTPQEEGRLIASAIKGRIARDGARYEDFAILYRTNSQSRALEQELRNASLPYIIFSGNSFFDRAEVKDVMAYFKLVVNQKDDESFKRIVNKPARAIGDTTLAAVVAAATEAGTSLFEAASDPMTLAKFGLRAAVIEKIGAFCNMIRTLAARAEKEDAWDVAKAIAYDSGIYQFYKSDNSVEGQAKAANVDELLVNVKQVVEEQHNDDYEQLVADDAAENPDSDFEISEEDLPVVTLSRFLENISLLSNADTSEGDEKDDNKIALMTVHSSKGLEFPYVFVSGMEENLFPSGGSMITPDELEEERRLFYVALTRAGKAVTLTLSQTRMSFGKNDGGNDFHAPSRFLYEIAPQFMENPLSRPDQVSGIGAMDMRQHSPMGGRPGIGMGARPSVGGRPGVRPDVFGRRPLPKDSIGPETPRTSGIIKPSSATPVRRPAAAVKTPDPNFQPSPVADLRVGQRVEHNRFGYGVIKEFVGNMVDRAAIILFDEGGEKKLILKYAKIRII